MPCFTIFWGRYFLVSLFLGVTLNLLKKFFKSYLFIKFLFRSKYFPSPSPFWGGGGGWGFLCNIEKENIHSCYLPMIIAFFTLDEIVWSQ